MKILDITSKWFFSHPRFPSQLALIYVRGDAIVLVPFMALLLIVGIFSLKWMALLFSLFLTFRSLGEMIYWIHQQFGTKTYRPNDFGFVKLDNNAIYVIYQLISLALLVTGTGLTILILLTGN